MINTSLVSTDDFSMVLVRIQFHRPFRCAMEMRSIGLTLQQEIESKGGKCIVTFENLVLEFAVTGLRPELVERTLQPYTRLLADNGGNAAIHQKDDAPSPSNGLPSPLRVPGALLREKLTRKLIVSLPSGAYVVSNIYPGGQSAFAEQLGPPRTREGSWKRAVAAGAAQRLCLVVWNADDFNAAASGHFL